MLYSQAISTLQQSQQLIAGRIIIYLLKPASEIPTLLNQAEQKRLEDYKVDWKRQQFRRSKSFLRMLMSQLLKQPPDVIDYDTVANGKPILKKPPAFELHFNISHTRDISVVAIALQNFGIDIENWTRDIEYDEFARRYYHPNERVTDEQSFYATFTRKEAVLKADGVGLINELNDFDTSRHEVKFQQHQWQLKTFVLEAPIVCSIASKTLFDEIIIHPWR